MTRRYLGRTLGKLKITLCLLFVVIINTLLGCNFNTATERDVISEKDTTKFSYVLTSGQTYTLPDILEEISGITYLPSVPNTIFAVQDEDGILFSFDLHMGKIVNQFQFAGQGDYEGLASDGKEFFVLKSNGEIYSFPIGASSKSMVKHHTALLPNGEYESMAFDLQSNRLYVLCKNCRADKKSKTTTGYIFNWSSTGELHMERTFTIDLDEIKQLDKRMSKSFKPSAMAKHPENDEWYILSSIDKALVVTDGDFKVKKVVRFDRKTFEQPEGMIFDEHVNLYISSEAGSKANAKIYKIQQVQE